MLILSPFKEPAALELLIPKPLFHILNKIIICTCKIEFQLSTQSVVADKRQSNGTQLNPRILNLILFKYICSVLWQEKFLTLSRQ